MICLVRHVILNCITKVKPGYISGVLYSQQSSFSGGNLRTEIIVIGTEILMGETADTNSGWLAQRLPTVGLELIWITAVGDDIQLLTDVLSKAWARSDIVFVIGGLGPTEDDVTREAISRMLGEPLQKDPQLVLWLEERFRNRGTPISSHNLKQALLIPSASGLRNRMGTAPGWWVERDGRILITLPGPPNELAALWESEVLPQLKNRNVGEIIKTRTFKTIGLSEAAVDEIVHDLYHLPGIELGCYAKPDGIYLRGIVKVQTEGQAVKLLDGLESDIKDLIGSNLWGIDDETPQQKIGDLLKEKHLTVGVLESCTGGLVAGSITEMAGCSEYFKGGTVVYDTALKIKAGVRSEVIQKFGAISEQCASDMAIAAQQVHDADCGLSVTGVAGPGELEGKPVGLVHIGIAIPGSEPLVSTHQFPSRRPLVRGRAVPMALLELCKALQSSPT